MLVHVNVVETYCEEKMPRALSLSVRPTTTVGQLRSLILVQLLAAGAAGSLRKRLSWRRVSPAPATLVDQSGPPALESVLHLGMVAGGRCLDTDAVAWTMADLGLDEGSCVHCAASARVDEDQRITVFPHRCGTDGGRTVHVAGESFPFTSKPACRFGTVSVSATIDNGDSGFPTFQCVAPPHPAGPVTLSVSFDGGITWLEGPTFLYFDPSAQNCALTVEVPDTCSAGRHGVGFLRPAMPWVTRCDRGPDEPDNGAGCV